jgi:hypothetical protein
MRWYQHRTQGANPMTSLKNRLPSADTLASSQHAKTSVQFGSCARAGEFIDDRSCRERPIIADRGARHFLTATITARGDGAFRIRRAAANAENGAHLKSGGVSGGAYHGVRWGRVSRPARRSGRRKRRAPEVRARIGRRV